MSDYRCTKYCPKLCDVTYKKEKFLEEFQKVHPRAKNHYQYIRERKSEFKLEFLKIYNCKCVYCGNSINNLNIDHFEIDHFIPKDSFTDKNKANNIFNLVASCQACNRLKLDYDITDKNKALFDVEKSLPRIFIRDDDYYIKIHSDYLTNEEVLSFYNHLRLGYQIKRLDFILMELHGMIEDDKYLNIRNELHEIYFSLFSKRNLISSFSQ